MERALPIMAFFCGTIFFFGTFLAFFAYLRYLRHKEVLALAEKGLVHTRHTRNGKGTLRWGIVITALGVALSLGLYPLGWLIPDNVFPLKFGPWMLVGLLPVFFGLSLIAIYLLTQKTKGDPVQPLPVAEVPAPVEPFDSDDDFDITADELNEPAEEQAEIIPDSENE